MATLLLKHCHLISPDVDLSDAAILIDGNKIKQVFTAGDPLPAADKTIDAQNHMVMPGFIDVHCHGRSGCDFCDATEKAITTIAVDKLKEGVTTFLPTTLTLPEDQLAASLATARAYVAAGSIGCKVPGVHLEGPFIHPKCLGAQNPDFVRLPNLAEVKRLAAIFPVLKVSYAIDVEGGAAFASQLLSENITPSCVHSAGTYADFTAAHNHGLVNLSHFCNQMTPLHHRDIGLVGAGLLNEDVFIELICDKLHICPDMIRLVFKIKGPNRIQLISDAMRASGLPDGLSDIGGLAVIVKDGAARLASNGALAGSTLQLADALRNVREVTGLPLKELVKSTSFTQAQSLNLHNHGRISPGYFADLVFLDEAFKVKKVFVDGVEKL